MTFDFRFHFDFFDWVTFDFHPKISFGENRAESLKICSNWAKCVNQSADAFVCFWKSCLFWSSFFGQVRGSLGENMKCFDSKKCAQSEMKCSRFLEVIFIIEFFRASLGKCGQISFAPPKICIFVHLWMITYHIGRKNLETQQFYCKHRCTYTNL